RFEQGIVILLVLVPLWVVFAGRLRLGRWIQVPEGVLNAAWRPRQIEPVAETDVAIEPVTSLSPSVSRILTAAGAGGLLVWIALSSFRTDAPPILVTRHEAEEKARQELLDHGVRLDSTWTVLSRVDGQPGEQSRFVWEKGGGQIYQRLLGR